MQATPLSLTVAGRLDTMNGVDIEQRAGQMIEAGLREMVLECEGLEHLTSAGLRSLMTIVRTMHAVQGHVTLANLHGQPAEMFAVCGLEGLIPVVVQDEAPASMVA